MTQNDPRTRFENPFPGSLFANDFLCEAISDLDEWKEFTDSELDDLETALREIFEPFPTNGSPNESQTEDDLIWPVLRCLGWTASLRQQNLSERGRQDVPDGLLFEDETKKAHANGFPEWKRYEFGLAIVESKRWERPLDRRSGQQGEETAPSTQMLRYLRRVDDLTTGKLRWGVLTNGAHWRLYFSGARSVSEQFFEVDLARILNVPGHNEGLFALSEAARHHWLKVFALMFRREAFLPLTEESRTFHQLAINEGRRYEERVASRSFQTGISRGNFSATCALSSPPPRPCARPEDVREAALVILYRLLFVLYAEDRGLLPIHDTSLRRLQLAQEGAR